MAVTSFVEIPLTKGQVALVDVEDAELVMAKRWYAQLTSGIWYAVRDERKMPSGKVIYMHRYITGFNKVDHKNGNGLDNRRENLRSVTQSQNIQNTKKTTGTSSIYKGVSWLPSRSKWKASIDANAKKIYLGLFASEERAAMAYDFAAREYFGEYACVNFPVIGERSALTGEVVTIQIGS